MEINMFRKSLLRTAILFTLTTPLWAAQTVVPVYLVAQTGQGKEIGNVTLEDSICGVLLKPNLRELPPGIHGFHIHQVPNCGDNGMAAGGHLDPQNTNEHNGPYARRGHLGDLPVLIVDSQGNATLPTLAPRFKLSQIKGHALMIHAGGDNYSDSPEKMGGGGDRIACGVIPGKVAAKSVQKTNDETIIVPKSKTTTTETTTVIPSPETTTTETTVIERPPTGTETPIVEPTSRTTETTIVVPERTTVTTEEHP